MELNRRALAWEDFDARVMIYELGNSSKEANGDALFEDNRAKLQETVDALNEEDKLVK